MAHYRYSSEFRNLTPLISPGYFNGFAALGHQIRCAGVEGYEKRPLTRPFAHSRLVIYPMLKEV
jgi:hypothetical protein